MRKQDQREFLFNMCRTVGHAWYEIDATRPTIMGWAFANKCERCETERIDIINIRGDLNSRRYLYPDGYKHAGKLTRAEYRLLILKSPLSKATPKGAQARKRRVA